MGCATARPRRSGSAAAAPSIDSVARRETGKDRVMSFGPVEAGRARRLVFRLAVLAGVEFKAVALGGRLRMNAAAPVMANAWTTMRVVPNASATLVASAAHIMASASAL